MLKFIYLFAGPTFQPLCIHIQILYNLVCFCVFSLGVSPLIQEIEIHFFFFWLFDFCLLPNSASDEWRWGCVKFHKSFQTLLCECSSSAFVETATVHLCPHHRYLISSYYKRALNMSLKVFMSWSFLCAGFPRCLGRDISCSISNAQNGVSIKWTLNVYSCMLWFPNDVDVDLLKIWWSSSTKIIKSIFWALNPFKVRQQVQSKQAELIAGYPWNCITTVNITLLVFKIVRK